MDGLYSLAGKGNKTREQKFYHSEIITGEYNKKHHFSVKNMKNRSLLTVDNNERTPTTELDINLPKQKEGASVILDTSLRKSKKWSRNVRKGPELYSPEATRVEDRSSNAATSNGASMVS
jgi:hypothetical protein